MQSSLLLNIKVWGCLIQRSCLGTESVVSFKMFWFYKQVQCCQLLIKH